MLKSLSMLAKADEAAVAPTIALSLFALIAAGGVAFDYARAAALDTELQNAADQAALAAASQLDGTDGSMQRATAAARALVANQTRFGNDGGGISVAVDSAAGAVVFYATKAHAEADTNSFTDTSKFKDAKFVKVRVAPRDAVYTLTPVVRAFRATMGGEAVAGLGSAICRVPPVMMCNPNPTASSFDVSSFVGKGMRLIATGGGGAYVPGDFGFLDVGAGASDLSKLMGYGSAGFDCVDVSRPSTEPGSMTSVINEYNTRFDIFESGDSINCYSQGKCPPSINSRKDLVMKTGSDPSKLSECGIPSGAGGKGWVVSNTPYRPSSAAVLPTSTTPDAMGYPRDLCHAHSYTGSCAGGRTGTGNWDIDAYWRVNHAGGAFPASSGLYPTSANSTIMAAAPLPAGVTRSYPTRYQVYRWEMANRATELPVAGRSISGVGTDYGQPICKAGLAGSVPGSTTVDRRVLPVAVVDCTGLSGKKPVTPIDWIDVFLVEPSTKREVGSGPSKTTYTEVGDIYVEVIGRTSTGTGGTTNQFVRRDTPYLVR